MPPLGCRPAPSLVSLHRPNLQIAASNCHDPLKTPLRDLIHGFQRWADAPLRRGSEPDPSAARAETSEGFGAPSPDPAAVSWELAGDIEQHLQDTLPGRLLEGSKSVGQRKPVLDHRLDIDLARGQKIECRLEGATA